MTKEQHSQRVKIGIIGGSGLYHMDHMEEIEQVYPLTPWGYPSDKIRICQHNGQSGLRIAFLARHGSGHSFSPSDVPYRANIAALKSLGVEIILAFSAVGSLKEEIRPLDFVLPSQLIDRTKGVRAHSFFESGLVAHVEFGDPICEELSNIVYKASQKPGVLQNLPGFDHLIKVHLGKTLVVMEGPAFSTRAESNFYRHEHGLNADIINMSSLPEAKLAREAEISYALVCMATDYDCWRESEEGVNVESVLKVLRMNAQNAKNLLSAFLDLVEDIKQSSLSQEQRILLGKGRGAIKDGMMKHAVITAESHRCQTQVAKLNYLLPGYF